jgi:transcriptional regulator with XRE-family HTH domain
MSFAKTLQELREKAGLSQSQLADAAGVPVWTLRGYEQGKREPLWDVLFKLADALGVDCRAFSAAAKEASAVAEKKPARKPAAPPKPRGRSKKGAKE